MLNTKLRTVGGSVMFAIPKSIIEGLELAPNDAVGLSVSKGKLIIDPHPRPRHTLQQLLAVCDAMALPSIEDKLWFDDGPIGGEAI